MGDVVRLCRFIFNHEYAVVLYRPRDPSQNRLCKSKRCPYKKVNPSTDKPWKVKEVINKFCGEQWHHTFHPKYCSSALAESEVKKAPLRRGKDLVLPQVTHLDGEDGGPGRILLSFKPRVNLENCYGRLGRVMVLRYNPCVGSSNPAAQVVMRCNLDVQCMDRVYMLSDEFDSYVPDDYHAGNAGGSEGLPRSVPRR